MAQSSPQPKLDRYIPSWHAASGSDRERRQVGKEVSLVKRIGMVRTTLVVALVVGTPALATHKPAHTVSCKQIKDALASGKTTEDVEKDMKVSAARVKSCTAPSHHKSKETAKHT